MYPEYTDKQIASVPGVYLRDNELNLVAFNGIGILIRDADEKIVGVQCRRDRVEKGQAKYIWLSSATASEWKNCSGGASCGSPQDVLYPVIARNRCNICIAEGKFKTEILAQQGNTGISVQGVGNFKGIETQIKKVCEKCKINGHKLKARMVCDKPENRGHEGRACREELNQPCPKSNLL